MALPSARWSLIFFIVSRKVDIFLVCGLGIFFCLVQLFLDGLEIGQCEFGVDRLDVIERIDDLPVTCVTSSFFETTYYVRDRICLSNIGKELIAEPLAFRRAPRLALRCRRTPSSSVCVSLRLHDFRQHSPDADPEPARCRHSDRSCKTDSSPLRSPPPSVH